MGKARKETTKYNKRPLSDLALNADCACSLTMSFGVTEVEEAKKEEEETAKEECTPEERAEDIARLEEQLEALEERKHSYFLGLKKVPSLAYL